MRRKLLRNEELNSRVPVQLTSKFAATCCCCKSAIALLRDVSVEEFQRKAVNILFVCFI